jgi:hypothetical protein
LQSIAKYCPKLKVLRIGGSPVNYNLKISREGFETFSHSEMHLEEIAIEYCARVGDEVIGVVSKKFSRTL